MTLPSTAVYTVLQAAEQLGVRLDQMYRLVRGGELQGSRRIDGRWAIPAAAVEARLARLAGRRKGSPSNTEGSQLQTESPETTGPNDNSQFIQENSPSQG